MATADLLLSSERRGVFAGAQLDARDVLEPRDGAVRRGANHDLTEFFRRAQPAARVDRDLIIDAGHGRRPANDARRHVEVLVLDGVDHVAGRQPAFGHLARIEPDAHGVVAGTEEPHVADAGQPREPVLDVDDRVIAQVDHVVAVVRREQVNDHGQVGRTFHRGDAELLRFLRQTGQRLVDAILHELGGEVGIGTELEGDCQRHQAVGSRLRGHVEHVLDALDLFLDRVRHGFRDGLGIRARELRRNDDRRRHDLGIFRDRQAAHGDEAADENERRQHAGENRPVDEEFGKVHRGIFYPAIWKSLF